MLDKMASEEEVQVLMELHDDNINFVAEESVPHKHLVFRIVNTLGDDSTALANMAVMFRGSEVDLIAVLGVFLAVKNKDEFQRIGTATPDEDDGRVFRIGEWTSSVPLPLGNELLPKLRLVILLDDHLDPGRVKFGADLVPFPEVFLQGSPRMKRKLGTSTLKFRGGSLTDIEQAMSALSLDGKMSTEPSSSSVSFQETPKLTMKMTLNLSSQPKAVEEFWWTPPSIPFKDVRRV